MDFRVRFLGGVSSVGGSCSLVKAGSKKILVDCGAGYKKRQEIGVRFPLDEEIDYCIITHAHLDHLGLVPLLIRYKKLKHNVISTLPTKLLAKIILEDFKRIYASDYNEIPFSENDLNELFSKWITLDYYEEMNLGKMVKIRFYEASHIIGSASVSVDYADEYSIFFTGDLGTACSKLLKYPPKQPKGVGYVVLESTYGDTYRIDDTQETVSFIKHVLDNKGRVFIPAFSVGRAQEVIYALNKHGVGKSYPIYLDSPMAHKVTHLSNILLPFMKFVPDIDKNLFSGYRPIKKRKDSRKLAKSKSPCVIVSASGMLSGGRIMNYYTAIKNDSRSAIVFVGYQAEGTLGRKILDEKESVKCKVFNSMGFSAHADKGELLAYMTSFGYKPRGVFLVHGGDEQRESLAKDLKRMGYRVLIPSEGDEYTLEQFPLIHSELTYKEKAQYGFEPITVEEFKEWLVSYVGSGYVDVERFNQVMAVACLGINTALSWCRRMFISGDIVPPLRLLPKNDKKRIKRKIYETFCRAVVWLDFKEMIEIKKELNKVKSKNRAKIGGKKYF